MKTIREFFPNHTLKDKYDLELPQLTAEDVEAYAIHILQSLAEDCEEMDVKEKDPIGVDLLGEKMTRFRTIYAIPKQAIINKINNIW